MVSLEKMSFFYRSFLLTYNYCRHDFRKIKNRSNVGLTKLKSTWIELESQCKWKSFVVVSRSQISEDKWIRSIGFGDRFEKLLFLGMGSEVWLRNKHWAVTTVTMSSKCRFSCFFFFFWNIWKTVKRWWCGFQFFIKMAAGRHRMFW